MESQAKLNENRKKHLTMLGAAMVEEMPELPEALTKMGRAVYADGVLSAKTKRLMAMVLALGSGCRNCVLAQAEHAMGEGATKREFLEALAVVISMRGTTGVAESLRVVQYLDEAGVW